MGGKAELGQLKFIHKTGEYFVQFCCNEATSYDRLLLSTPRYMLIHDIETPSPGDHSSKVHCLHKKPSKTKSRETRPTPTGVHCT